VPQLQGRIEALETENARLRRDSSNSHKPPSSDIVKPRPSARAHGAKRSIGGQRGHPRHQRKPFAPDQIDDTKLYELQHCPDCGGSLEPAPPDAAAWRVLQQVELAPKPLVITEHRAPAYWCPHCRKFHRAPLPAEVRAAGLVGTRLSALVGWLKGTAHASYSTIQALLRDVLGVEVSRGHLVNLVQKAPAALNGPYEELRAALPVQVRLNVDETGHKELGKRLWTWCFRAPLYTLLKIDTSRGSKVLLDTLGEDFEGVLGCDRSVRCDYFSAYRKYMGDTDTRVQFCMAHLVRDVRFVATHLGPTGRYGHKLLERLRGLFHTFHRREEMSREDFQAALQRERRKLVRVATRPPDARPARNMAERFRRHADAYFRFITTPGVEPTNNLAEQALRSVVIDRRITQGTRGVEGRLRCERLWTASATCRQQGRSVFEFLHSALHAYLTGQPPPSLLAA